MYLAYTPHVSENKSMLNEEPNSLTWYYKSDFEDSGT